MSIIAIDPGTTNTGLVYMDERRVICAKTIPNHARARNLYELKARVVSIATQVSDWMADKPHDAVIMEGFIFQSRQYRDKLYQTPHLVGALMEELRDENLVLQTSEIFNPKRKNNVADLKGQIAAGISPGWAETEKCTNDHTRSAVCHGIYYYMTAKQQRMTL